MLLVLRVLMEPLEQPALRVLRELRGPQALRVWGTRAQLVLQVLREPRGPQALLVWGARVPQVLMEQLDRLVKLVQPGLQDLQAL